MTQQHTETTTERTVEARAHLAYLHDNWQAVRARIRPAGSSALTGLPTPRKEHPAPINISASALLQDVTFWAIRAAQHIEQQTGQAPDLFRMPDLLQHAAAHADHLTEEDPNHPRSLAGLRRRAEHQVDPPDPAQYMGECPTDGCRGDLTLREGQKLMICPDCLKATSQIEQARHLRARLQTLVLTRGELITALTILGRPVTRERVRQWAARGRLVDVGGGRYRMREALSLLAPKGRRHARGIPPVGT